MTSSATMPKEWKTDFSSGADSRGAAYKKGLVNRYYNDLSERRNITDSRPPGVKRDPKIPDVEDGEGYPTILPSRSKATELLNAVEFPTVFGLPL